MKTLKIQYPFSESSVPQSHHLYLFSATMQPDTLNIWFADLIQEIITEDSDRPGASLPGPPPPPVDLLCQPHSQSTRMRQQSSSSPSSQPVLVARGTACQVSEFKSIIQSTPTVYLAGHLCSFWSVSLVFNSGRRFIHSQESELATWSCCVCVGLSNDRAKWEQDTEIFFFQLREREFWGKQRINRWTQFKSISFFYVSENLC